MVHQRTAVMSHLESYPTPELGSASHAAVATRSTCQRASGLAMAAVDLEMKSQHRSPYHEVTSNDSRRTNRVD